jgi:hypothetical protein
MEIKQTLAEVLANPWIKKLPAPSLVASALAALIHPVLAAVGFEISGATTALAKIGFEIGAGLMPSLIEVGKRGINALGDWLEKEIAQKPEINEAAAQTMVTQAETVSQTLNETHPEDKDEIADAVAEGLKAYGGAIAEIAEQYAVAMKNVTELNKLVEQMKEKIDVWSSQTIEAKRSSLIENVEMRIKGKGGKQKMSAEDDSIISGAKQIIE